MFYVVAVGWIWKLSQKVSVWSMAQEYEFQYKVATSKKKNPLAPALTRQGARKSVASPHSIGRTPKNGGVGQMPTEKGRFSSSGASKPAD